MEKPILESAYTKWLFKAVRLRRRVRRVIADISIGEEVSFCSLFLLLYDDKRDETTTTPSVERGGNGLVFLGGRGVTFLFVLRYTTDKNGQTGIGDYK